MRNKVAPAMVLLAASWLLGCSPRSPATSRDGSATATTRLRPVAAPVAEPAVRRTVYVPVYSRISLGTGVKQSTTELSVTMSVRNVSRRHPLVLNGVAYYDSDGALVRQYLGQPGELAPLATVEFIVLQKDTVGGPGAKFLVGWEGPAGIDEPIVEAVMVGLAGNIGLAFTTSGRAVTNGAP
jgi:hypothetical protein